MPYMAISDIFCSDCSGCYFGNWLDRPFMKVNQKIRFHMIFFLYSQYKKGLKSNRQCILIFYNISNCMPNLIFLIIWFFLFRLVVFPSTATMIFFRTRQSCVDLPFTSVNWKITFDFCSIQTTKKGLVGCINFYDSSASYIQPELNYSVQTASRPGLTDKTKFTTYLQRWTRKSSFVFIFCPVKVTKNGFESHREYINNNKKIFCCMSG